MRGRRWTNYEAKTRHLICDFFTFKYSLFSIRETELDCHQKDYVLSHKLPNDYRHRNFQVTFETHEIKDEFLADQPTKKSATKTFPKSPILLNFAN